MHDELLRRFDNERRSGHGGRAFTRAWQSLSDQEKDQIRSEEIASGKGDPYHAPYADHHTFDKKDDSTMEEFAKAHGMKTVAEKICKAGSSGTITQHEFVSL